MPYIPEDHKQYNLLPYCTEYGGEVFEYPSQLLEDVEELLKSDASVMPYNFSSYDDYYDMLNDLITQHKDSPNIVERIVTLRDAIKSMNQKEEWSVLQYLGPSDDAVFGLTHGKYYYWPSRFLNPVYCGVIDDEEFTAYWYPTEAHLWKILEDPTGMAHNTIYGSGKNKLSQASYDHMMEQLHSAVIENMANSDD